MHLNNSFHRLQFIAGFSAFIAIVISAWGCNEITNNAGENNLSAPSVQPRIVSTTPRSGSTGPFSLYNRGDGYSKPHFVMTFNKLMYKGSFTPRSFRVQGFDAPATARIEGTTYYGPLEKSSSTSSIYYDNVLSFFIVDSVYTGIKLDYRIGRQYIVTLDSTVEDINGNHLSSSYTFVFTPEPNFRVVGSFPKNGAQDISIGYGPDVIFNSRVHPSILGAMQLSPAVPGGWRIDPYDSSEVYFIMTHDWPYNRTFVMTVQGTATDAEQNPIDREYTSEFSTIAFRPTYIYPQNGATNVDLTTYLSVQFSGLIDTGTVRSGFTISPPTASSISMYYPTPSFSVNLRDGFHQNTTYTLTITQSLKASDGTPSVPTTSTFRTGAFRVTSTSPGDEGTNVYRNSAIYLYTSARLDGSTIGSALAITPAVIGNISFNEGSSTVVYSPSGQLAANTLYTVSLSTALKSKAGDNLAAPYTFSFRTGN